MQNLLNSTGDIIPLVCALLGLVGVIIAAIISAKATIRAAKTNKDKRVENSRQTTIGDITNNSGTVISDIGQIIINGDVPKSDVDDDINDLKKIISHRDVLKIIEYYKLIKLSPCASINDITAVTTTKAPDNSDKTIVDINIENVNLSTNDNNFVMAFANLSSTNWTDFYADDYSLAFEVAASGSIQALQIEVKDTMGNKLIDERLFPITSCYTFKLNDYNKKSCWGNVKEICFTLFINDSYITGVKGYFTIANLRLIPQ